MRFKVSRMSIPNVPVTFPVKTSGFGVLTGHLVELVISVFPTDFKTNALSSSGGQHSPHYLGSISNEDLTRRESMPGSAADRLACEMQTLALTQGQRPPTNAAPFTAHADDRAFGSEQTSDILENETEEMETFRRVNIPQNRNSANLDRTCMLKR
jgi:hypothetical protein